MIHKRALLGLCLLILAQKESMATSPITENKTKESVSPIGQKIQNTVYFKSKAYFNVLTKKNSLFLKSMERGLAADPSFWKIEITLENGKTQSLKWNHKENAWEVPAANHSKERILVSKRLNNTEYRPLFIFKL
jgi:hypothetical protein